MQFLLLATETDDAFAARSDPARAEAYWDAWSGYIAALDAAGIVASAAGLEPPSMATTVRVAEGRRRVQDGPFADSKEHLGGYFVIDVPDLDAASPSGPSRRWRRWPRSTARPPARRPCPTSGWS